jgi:predicted ester cyclase
MLAYCNSVGLMIVLHELPLTNLKTYMIRNVCSVLMVLLLWNSATNAQTKSRPETEKNKKLILLIVDQLFNKGDSSVADKYFEPEFAREEKAFTKLIRTAFPDLKIVVDIQVAEKNLVAARWIATGTHSATFLGVPPTYKKVSWKGSWFWTFKKGVIIDGMGKGSWDALDLLKQLQAK